MERSLSPSVIVFDLGGVLVPAEGALTDLAAELDVDRGDLARAYWRVRDDYDRGGTSTAFWAHVTDELGREADPDHLDRIDAALWSDPAPGVRTLLDELGASGARLAVLSNAPAALAATVRAASWSSAFETLLFSSDLGALKPESEIYACLEQRLAVPAGDLFFCDDRAANVEGARQRGWRAELWTSVDQGRAGLVAVGALAAAEPHGLSRPDGLPRA